MADNFNARLYARSYGTSAYSGASYSQPPPTTCAPACVTCGLLECLCRPRFFAGQLLSEVDLNRLDAYIRAKNRLHNVQLHGWGVVNGLQVRCDPCGSGVIVGTGYAIDPCGEDIVVCNDTPVDICALIKRCQRVDVTCQPSSRTGGTTTCDDVAEDWVLAIRYTETQARGVTALRSTPSCGCGATGGSCSGGSNCGCGKKMTSTAATNPLTTTSTQKPRNPPAECEATAICEGYSFDVFPAPVTPARQKGDLRIGGPLIDTFLCCLQPLIAALPVPPQGGATTSNFSQQAPAWNLWCCRTKAALIGYFSTGPEANCALLGRLQAWSCPDPTDEQSFADEMAQAYETLVSLLLEAMLACLCAALQPPAPFGTSDDRVPLALVRVRKQTCQVLEVCNWTSLRKRVITWPAMEYWLSWIPWLASLDDIIGALCCRGEPSYAYRSSRMAAPPAPAEAASAAGAASPTASEPVLEVNPTLDADRVTDNQTMTRLVIDALSRARAPIDPAAVAGGVFGFDSGAKQPLGAEEKANILPFLLINEVLRPIVSSLVPASAGGSVLAGLERIIRGGDGTTAADETAALHKRVAVLEGALKAMQDKQREQAQPPPAKPAKPDRPARPKHK